MAPLDWLQRKSKAETVLATHGWQEPSAVWGHFTPKWQVYQMSEQGPHYEDAMPVLVCSESVRLCFPSEARSAPSPLLLQIAVGVSCATSPGKAKPRGPTLRLFSKEMVRRLILCVNLTGGTVCQTPGKTLFLGTSVGCFRTD